MTKPIKPSVKILQAMEVIGVPERWTKDQFARDSYGNEVGINSKKAVCFCSVGALDKVKASIKAKDYLNKTVVQNGQYSYLVDFNDQTKTKHKDVMNLFMTAAFLALSEGK